MIESINKVSNPLTIIAIFAGLAEVSGTVVLPFLNPESQHLYVWFLMFFPGLLISIFFLTLNFNHTVLYAPSDFKDEDNFLKLFGKPTFEEKLIKLETEFGTELLELQENPEDGRENQVVNPDVENATEVDNTQTPYSPTVATPEDDISEIPAFLRSAIKNSKSREVSPLLIQDLVLTKLSREFETFDKDRVVRTFKANFLFDAVAYKNGQVFAIEVHRLNTTTYSLNFHRTISEIIAVLSELNSPTKGSVKLILALILSKEFNYEVIMSKLASAFDDSNFEYEIRKFEYELLKNEILVKSRKS